MTWAEINAGIPPANNPQRVALRNNSNMAASIRGGNDGRDQSKVGVRPEPNPANAHLETTCESSGPVGENPVRSLSTLLYRSPTL